MTVAITTLIAVFMVAVGYFYTTKGRRARRARMLRLAEEYGGTFVARGSKEHIVGDTSYVTFTHRGRRLTLSTGTRPLLTGNAQVMSVATHVDTRWQLTLIPRGALVKMIDLATLGSAGATRDRAFDDAYRLMSSRLELAGVLFGSRPELRATPMRLGRLYIEAFSEELTLTLPENPRSTGATERVMIDYALTLARALERGENLLDGVDLEGASGALTVTTSEDLGGALSQTHAPVGALSPGGEPVD